MYLWTYILTCMYMYMYVCVYVCIYTRIHVLTYVHTSISTYPFLISQSIPLPRTQQITAFLDAAASEGSALLLTPYNDGPKGCAVGKRTLGCYYVGESFPFLCVCVCVCFCLCPPCRSAVCLLCRSAF